MKLFLILVGLASLALGVPSNLHQPEQLESCHFTVSGETIKPIITGPDAITPLVYIVDQPDSPVQIVSMDLTGSVLSVANDRFTYKSCSTIKVRNRSDQTVSGLEVGDLISSHGFGPGSGFSSLHGPDIAPGQETEIKLCGGGGSGDAGANQVRIFAFVEKVGINKCVYLPSKRIPDELAER